MKLTFHIRNISDTTPYNTAEHDIRSKISTSTYHSEQTMSIMNTTMSINATIILLVLSGTCTMRINYKQYKIEANTLILLSAAHLFCFRTCSSDFKIQSVMVSKEFMDEMDSTDMIYKRIKYGVKLFNTPIINLTKEQTTLIHHRINEINHSIENNEHLYQKEMVLNSLLAFYLESSNIIDHEKHFLQNTDITRQENTTKTFIELLSTHYRKNHSVDFYAKKLNISSHYLSLIVKKITGQTPSDFIFEMLYSDARNLLRHSKLSAQEISTTLNFSDQSSFGKFFKRKSGISPADYRKNNT